MSDLISRSALIEALGNYCPDYKSSTVGCIVKSTVNECIKIVNEQPTIEAVPVVYGCNNNQNYHEVDEFRCSVCGLHLEDWERHVHDGGAEFIREYEFKYCPECGVKIKGGAE